MNTNSTDAPILTFSVKVYKALLVAYPTKFQREYGAHMAQVFRDCCLRSFQQGGTNGLVRIWAITFLDFLRSVFEQHLQKDTYMSKAQFIKLSGWAFILAPLTFLPISGESNSLSLALSVTGSILLAIGLLGLRARYSESAGRLGKSILLIGVIGMVLLYAFLILMTLLTQLLPIIWIQIQDIDNLWILLFGGPAILLTALTLFGVTAFRNKPMARLNWLSVLAGIWYPAIYFFVLGYLSNMGGVFPSQYWTTGIVMSLIQCAALFIFGLDLVTEKHQVLATA